MALRAWWRKKPTDPTLAPAAPPAAEADHDPELPPYDPAEWAPAPADRGWLAAAAELEPADDGLPNPDRPYFAFVDAGGPDGDSWRAAGWWLQAEPKPQRHFLAAAAEPVPALLKAWTYTAEEPPELRGDARIAALAALRGRFDPDQVADLL
jgi:hypothetical protein